MELKKFLLLTRIKLVIVDVNANDSGCSGLLASKDDSQAHGTQAPDGARGALLNLHDQDNKWMKPLQN